MESVIEQLGALGVGILMLLENVVPPIPSELVMPLGGYSAAEDGGAWYGALLMVILAGSIGSVLGAVLWYWVGYRIGTDGLKNFSRKHGRFLTLTPDEIDKADRWFDRWGSYAVFAGRLVPTVRTFVSVPAGAACMGFGKFLVVTSAGTAIWSAALAVAGWRLGSRYEEVSNWVGPVSTAVIAGIVVWYVYRVVTFRRKVPKERSA